MKPPALGQDGTGGGCDGVSHVAMGARVSLPLVWMVVLWWLSSIPEGPERIIEGLQISLWFQKTMHVVAYAILATTWIWTLRGRLSLRGVVTTALVLTVAYAVVDEIHQGYVPGRTSAATDVLIDLFGALLAITLATGMKRFRRLGHLPEPSP